jgi:hypothetical protein
VKSGSSDRAKNLPKLALGWRREEKPARQRPVEAARGRG